MAANKAQDERNMKVLRQLSNEPDNKKCMDCGIKGTVYVCSNFNTFICTSCSGLHREFNHRVKSISMTTFKPEEIKNLQAGGNAVARRKWLARWTNEDFPEPDPADAQRVKSFMKLKYIDKRWYSETGEGPQNSSSNSSHNYSTPPSSKSKQEQYPQPVPLTTILGNDIPPLHINGANKHPTGTSAPAHPQPTSQNNNAQNLVDWNATTAPKPSAHSDLDDLLSIPSTTQQQQYQQQIQQQQHQNTYQQQQQLIMSQFGAHQQGGWGQPAQGFGYPPSSYGNPQGGFGQQPPGFYGGVATPPNFFAPPPAQPANLYSTPATTGTISPAFGQSGGHNAAGTYGGGGLSPSPTPISQPNAYGGHPGLGATLSPAQPPNAFIGSPALHAGVGGSGGFALSPSLHSTPGFGAQPGFGGQPGFGAQPPSFGAQPPGFGGQPPGFGSQPALSPAPAPAPQPPADKFDIFASLSPLNAANSSSVAKPSSFPPANHSSHSSFPSVNPSLNPSTSHSNNPNPFADPFGANTGSQPSHSLSQPAHAHAPPAANHNMSNSDPFGGFGGTPSPLLPSKPTQPNNMAHMNGSDPFGGGFGNPPNPTVSSGGGGGGGGGGFGNTPSPMVGSGGFGVPSPTAGSGGFGGAPNPSKPTNNANSDPFGFGGPTPTPSSQQHQQHANNNNNNNNHANPFGDNPFGASPAQPPTQPSSAFSPYNQNPFGQQPTQQQQSQQADPFANPFF